MFLALLLDDKNANETVKYVTCIRIWFAKPQVV